MGAAEAVLDAALADESDRLAALEASASSAAMSADGPSGFEAAGAELSSAADAAADRRRPRHLRAVPAGGDHAHGGRDDHDDRDDQPRHLRPGERGRTGRLVRRLVAVKAVAATTAVAIGITAAAATTGIGIVTVVVPAARDRLVTDDRPNREVVEDDGPSRRSESERRADEERSRSCTPGQSSCRSGDERPGEPPDAEADPSSTTGTSVATETTVASEPTTGATPAESPTTAPPDPGSGTSSSPPATTETTVPTTAPPSTTTSTTTTEPPPEPHVDSQAAAEPSGAGSLQTLAAAPADPTTTQG